MLAGYAGMKKLFFDFFHISISSSFYVLITFSSKNFLRGEVTNRTIIIDPDVYHSTKLSAK